MHAFLLFSPPFSIKQIGFFAGAQASECMSEETSYTILEFESVDRCLDAAHVLEAIKAPLQDNGYRLDVVFDVEIENTARTLEGYSINEIVAQAYGATFEERKVSEFISVFGSKRSAPRREGKETPLSLRDAIVNEFLAEERSLAAEEALLVEKKLRELLDKIANR